MAESEVTRSFQREADELLARLRTVEAEMSDVCMANIALTEKLAFAQEQARGYVGDVAKAMIRARAAEARVEALSEDNELLRSGQTTLIEQCDSLAARVEALEAALRKIADFEVVTDVWPGAGVGGTDLKVRSPQQEGSGMRRFARAALAVSGNQP